jgi:hypothetical protein
VRKCRKEAKEKEVEKINAWRPLKVYPFDDRSGNLLFHRRRRH